MTADREMRAAMERLPVPDLGPTPFHMPVDLARAQVAIVTTAGLHRDGEASFGLLDPSYRVLPHGDPAVVMSHNSQNFDRAGVMHDRNVVYPVDRLDELAAAGTIGAVAPAHISFMGAQQDLATILHDTGPRAAQVLRDQGTDIVLLTPV